MNDEDNKFFAPDAALIKALAQAAVASLPGDLQLQAMSVALKVQDFVDGDHFEDLGLEDPYELVTLIQSNPDTIWLFRRPILDEWAERGDICLADLVMHILVLELSDHFGWSDAEITAHPSLRVAFRAAQRRVIEREG